MKPERIGELSIHGEASLFEALERMDKAACKLLLVTKEKLLLGLLSIGDIQRSILANRPLSTKVSEVLRSDILYCSDKDSREGIKAIMLENRCEFMPVVDAAMGIVDVISWDELFTSPRIRSSRTIPVVVMAGGLGLRLRPLTNVIPKPLIPVGDMTILERIVRNFAAVGSIDFYVSVNYKAAMIDYYLSTVDLGGAKISLVEEDKPLGTAGPLKLVEPSIHETFFVTNCDILIDWDYNEIYDHHKLKGNALTIVSAIKRVDIPYGVLRYSDGGRLLEIEEKPSQCFAVNTGMYVMEPSILGDIVGGESLGMPELAKRVMARGGRVGIFPISDGSWFDIGNWDDYQQTLRDYQKA